MQQMEFAIEGDVQSAAVVKAFKHPDGFAVQVNEGPVYVYTNVGAVLKVVKRELDKAAATEE